ncbi:MAG: BLUF domain-containing protein [Gimesia sp.]
MKLYQLIYVSKSISRLTRVELNEISKIARQNNSKRGITGMLVYDRGHFIQVLEGEYNDVETMFAKIQEDKRHCKINRITSFSIQERYFEGWNMGFYCLDETTEFDFHKLKKSIKLVQDSTRLSKMHSLGKKALKIFFDLKEHSKPQPNALIGSG